MYICSSTTAMVEAIATDPTLTTALVALGQVSTFCGRREVLRQIGERLDQILPVTRFTEASRTLAGKASSLTATERRHLAGEIVAAALWAHTGHVQVAA